MLKYKGMIYFYLINEYLIIVYWLMELDLNNYENGLV
jgi:hypothetical protein